MVSIDRLILAVLMALVSPTNGKTYSAVELNRLSITKLYRNHILTRPSMNNASLTTVAIGLGIIEVAGIDPQKQVSFASRTMLSTFPSIRSSRWMSISNWNGAIAFSNGIPANKCVLVDGIVQRYSSQHVRFGRRTFLPSTVRDRWSKNWNYSIPS